MRYQSSFRFCFNIFILIRETKGWNFNLNKFGLGVKMGKIVDAPVDFYSDRVPKRQQKKTILEELIDDAKVKKLDFRLILLVEILIVKTFFIFEKNLDLPRSTILLFRREKSIGAKSCHNIIKIKNNRKTKNLLKNKFVFLC